MSPSERIQREEFEHLVRAHHLAVYRTALRVTRSGPDAHDATQQVFVAVLEGKLDLARAADPARVLRWWAVRTALAQLRGARNARATETRYAMGRREGHEEAGVERDEARNALERLVGKLPEELRLPLELRFREDLTFAEIGTALAVSEPTAHERVKRALERLRFDLGKLGLGALAVDLEGALAHETALAAPQGLAAELLTLQAGAVKTVAASGASALPGLALGGALALTVAVLAWVAIGSGERTQDPRPGELAYIGGGTAPRSGSATSGATRAGYTGGEPALPAREPASTAVTTAPPAPPAAAPTDGRRARVSGRVLDELGLGVGGASVFVAPPGKGDPIWREHGKTTTRPDGTYEIVVDLRLERETLEIAFEHAEYALGTRGMLRVSDGENAVAPDLVVTRITSDPEGEFTLALTVVDAEGRPVAGVPARLFRRGKNMFGNPGLEWEAGGLTDASGRLDLAGQRLGEKRIVLDARDAGWRIHREVVRVDAAGRRDVAVRLDMGGVLAGTLRALDGTPAADVTLFVRGASGNEELFTQGTSDAQGRFRLAGLEPVPTRVSIQGDGFSSVLLDVTPSREDLDLRLKPADATADEGEHMAELHGHLVDARTGARVAAPYDAVDVERVESATRAVFLAHEAARHLIQAPRQTATMFGWKPPPPSSEFHLTGLEPGRYVLVARVKDHPVSFAGPFELGARTLVADVVLALEQAVQVEGRVVDARGAPVPAAVIVIAGAAGGDAEELAELDQEVARTEGHPRHAYQTLASGQDGRFVFNAPPGMGLKLHALHARFLPAASAAGTTKAGMEAFRIRFERAR